MMSVICKGNPFEVNTGPYITVILLLLQANIIIQYVTGMYATLIYLTSCLSKPEHTVGELIKKAAKEATGLNIFLTKNAFSSHKPAKRELSFCMCSSNILTKFVQTDLEKQRTRFSLEILVKMDPEDTNIYVSIR